MLLIPGHVSITCLNKTHPRGQGSGLGARQNPDPPPSSNLRRLCEKKLKQYIATAALLSGLDLLRWNATDVHSCLHSDSSVSIMAAFTL